MSELSCEIILSFIGIIVPDHGEVVKKICCTIYFQASNTLNVLQIIVPQIHNLIPIQDYFPSFTALETENLRHC